MRGATRSLARNPRRRVVLALAWISALIALHGHAHAATAVRAGRIGRVGGRVWQDVNRNGAVDAGEPGIGDAWVAVIGEDRTVIASSRTGPDGSYELRLAARTASGTPCAIECIPPAGRYPTTPVRRMAVDPSRDGGAPLDFGMDDFRAIPLSASRVTCLVSGDLAEKDWHGDRVAEARRDADLVLGTAEANGDEVSVWLNHYDNPTLFTTSKSYSRSAPQSVLALAIDSLGGSAATSRRRMDLVTGTVRNRAGNFFVWHTQQTRDNEGYLPARYSDAYQTLDGGDVQAVATGDVTGDGIADIVIGTRSPAPGRGTVELWRGSGDPRPTFTRGALDGLPEPLGEVTAMRLAAVGADGSRLLVIGTRTSRFSGQVLLLVAGPRGRTPLRLRRVQSLDHGAVTGIATGDYDLDGRVDVIVATQTSSDSGEVRFWRNVAPPGIDSLAFIEDPSLRLGAVPVSIACADMGGSANPDVLLGLRANETSYRGSLALYYMDGGVLPEAPADPSGGSVTAMVSAIAVDHFNAGATPPRRTPDPPDIAIGVRTGPMTGNLVVFIR